MNSKTFAALISTLMNAQPSTVITKADHESIVADLALACVDSAKQYDEDQSDREVYQRAVDLSNEIVEGSEYTIYTKYHLPIIKISDNLDQACIMSYYECMEDAETIIKCIAFECLRADVDHKILKMYQAGECEIEKDEEEE